MREDAAVVLQTACRFSAQLLRMFDSDFAVHLDHVLRGALEELAVAASEVLVANVPAGEELIALGACEGT